MGKLTLDAADVRRARTLARQVGRPIVETAQQHTTVSVERATLRLAGLGGADAEGTPWVNRLSDVVRADVGLEHGVALPVWDALLRGEAEDLDHARPEGQRRLGDLPPRPRARDLTRARDRVPQGRRRRHQADRPPPRRAGADDRQGRRRPAQAVDLPHRRDRRHLRGHPAGPGGRPRGRRRHRGDPQHRPVAARLRARGRDPRGLRRHLRHPGELPPDAGGARRDQPRAGPLRAPHQLRVRPLHARDRRPGRPRAARHDAQRLDVRDPLPRHQPDPHLRRPALQPPGPRPRRDHHQHRRGQLPHHRRRGRGRAHGDDQPAAQRVLRQGGRPRGLAARPGPRLRDRPGGARLVPPRARPRAAGPRAVPQGAAQVDAADPAHDRRRLPRLPPRRLLQPRRRAHRPGHPAGRDDDRGRGHAVDLRPRPGPAERPLRHGRRRQAARGLPPPAATASSTPAPARCWGSRSSLLEDIKAHPGTNTAPACSTRSPTAPSAS